MDTLHRSRPCHPARRVGIATLALCGALLAPNALAQLTDWQWRPPLTPLDYDFASPYNWMVNWPYYEAASHPPNSSVRGRTFDGLADFGQLSTGVTLGSLVIGGQLHLVGMTPAASLLLGNDQGSPALMLGSPGSTEVNWVQSHFEDFTLFSSGVALLHGSSRLAVDRVNWVHDGTLVLGASTPGPTTAATIWIKSGSTLASGFDRLDVVVGSSSAGALRVESGGRLDASTVRVGRGSPQGAVDQLVVWGAEAQVRQSLDIGHLGGGLASVNGKGATPGLLEANAANIGFADGEAGRLEVGALGSARFNNLTVGMWSGSQGFIDVASGGQLTVNGTLQLGGGTRASLVSQAGSNLDLNAVTLGSGSGFADLSTAGPASIQRLNQEANSLWDTRGQTTVAGSVTVAQYGGRNIELRVSAGGQLQIGQQLWVGDYHHFETRPVDQRVVVEPGAQLLVDGGFSLYATASLSGGGTVRAAQGVRVYGGTVAPGMSPGHLTIDGDLTFSGGQLVIELGGLHPGTEHDLLDVLGTLTLGSQFGNGTTLVLEAVNGFTPQAGQGFDFLRAGQLSGSFASLVDHTGLGLTLDDLEFANGHFGINLAAAVPEPAAAWLMLMGLAGLALRRRH